MFLLLRNTGDLAYFGLEWVFDKNAAGAYLSTPSDSCIAYTLFTARVKELEFRFNFHLYLSVKNHTAPKRVM